ncbi:MAG: hypothetical protein KatS3mg055_1663 [Chloroflexus sp.]|uniref:hypothetical protein n=1 Tax=Chloroflexus sp. TaxID=1904827 RepID=UPI0021DE5606|nr:hypothetical protein [Chloroflexus sp.]GIV89145.1 MAG: hypothetical protein KatS3mg055_1663 [Chloroflexus sp.]
MSLKKKVVFILLLIVGARLLSFLVLHVEPYYILVPRSFTGRALLAQPCWIDIAIAVVAAIALWRPFGQWNRRELFLGMLDTLRFLLLPVLTGIALFTYVQDWHIGLQVNGVVMTRYAQFILAFVALNLIMDAASVFDKKWRYVIVSLAMLALAFTQDFFVKLPPFFAASVVSSVGVTLGLFVIALRPVYVHSTWRALAAAVLTGFVVCFVEVAAISDSLFTFLLPILAFGVGALTMRSTKRWPYFSAGIVVVGLSCFLSIGLPRIVPSEIAEVLVENIRPDYVSEQVGDVRVYYAQPELRDMAVRLAHVLDAANIVSESEFGVSPQVDTLIITGIGPGGFRADFSHRITGALVSDRYVELSLDETYLNSPDLSIHFPDPVNAILHEYAHLFGIVPYYPWLMGPEEEGWATYAATRLSLRLYETYGPALWDPPYNYARQATAITEANLAGHSVSWSHPYEFGGFRLWHALGERYGESELFRRRWLLTQREASPFSIISNPQAARQMIRELGETDFTTLSSGEAIPFAQVFALEDWMIMGDVLGVSPQEIQSYYERRADELVNPTVAIPHNNPIWVDISIASLLLLGVVIVASKSRLTRASP